MDTVSELRADTLAMKWLADLEELASVPPERGGFHFTEWERQFIKSMGEIEPPAFSPKQREKIEQLWTDVDSRKRPERDDKPANLFSNLSPKRQAEQRARAARVKLPWEK